MYVHVSHTFVNNIYTISIHPMQMPVQNSITCKAKKHHELSTYKKTVQFLQSRLKDFGSCLLISIF